MRKKISQRKQYYLTKDKHNLRRSGRPYRYDLLPSVALRCEIMTKELRGRVRKGCSPLKRNQRIFFRIGVPLTQTPISYSARRPAEENGIT